jgi:uncharacterized phage-associated protein
MINQYQEKLVSAIQYFASKVKYPTKTKIFKLLFFFDEEHYKQTGLTVTDIDYYAWSFGPVPRKIWFDIKDGCTPDYMKGKIKLIHSSLDEENGTVKLEFKSIESPNMSVFTPRQIKILKQLVMIYKDIKPNVISSISHDRNKPWDLTIRTKGEKQKIDLNIALETTDPILKDEAEQLKRERDEMIRNFSADPLPNAPAR